ncbi:MAG: serine/threonine-protein kinase [Chthoniobacteraceae bacterium]
MSESNHCPNCGVVIPSDAPEGVCPACVLARGVGLSASSSELATDEAAFHRSQIESLAAAFPEYELIELLGRGGMGEVYQARQKKLNRLVAIKILPEPFGKSDEFTERFHREAQSLARLNHPNIITIYDYGTTDGLCYFVMEYIDGVDLKRTIEAHTLTPEEALRIVPQICDALQFAHDAGIVHRDIKPANILITRDGRVKIADFGLAKIVSKAPADITLTGIGDVMGTPEYMAPEQRRSTQSVDHRADIYSLGVVFYEMLTGEVPMGRFEPPSHKVQVDVRLDDIVLRTLEREPERRYQKVSEVKSGVETVTSTALRRTPAVPTPKGQRFPFKLTILWTFAFAVLWFALGPLWNFRWPGILTGGLVLSIFVGSAIFFSRKEFPVIIEQWRDDNLVRRILRVLLLVAQCIAINALFQNANLGVKERTYWPRTHLEPTKFEADSKGEEFKLLRQLSAFSKEIPRAELATDGFSFSSGIAILSPAPPTLLYFMKLGIVGQYLVGLFFLANAFNSTICTDFFRLRTDPNWRRTIWPIAVLTLAAALSLALKFFGSIFTLPLGGITGKYAHATVAIPITEVREEVEKVIASEGMRAGDERRWTLYSVPEGKALAKVAISNAWRPSPFDRWAWRGWKLVPTSPQVSILYLSTTDPEETKVTFSMTLLRKDDNNPAALALLKRLKDSVENVSSPGK